MVGCLGATTTELQFSNNAAMPESAPAPPQYVHLVSNINRSISVSDTCMFICIYVCTINEPICLKKKGVHTELKLWLVLSYGSSGRVTVPSAMMTLSAVSQRTLSSIGTLDQLLMLTPISNGPTQSRQAAVLS